MTEVCLRESCLSSLDQNVVQENNSQIQNECSHKNEVKAEYDSTMSKEDISQNESNVLLDTVSIKSDDACKINENANDIPNEDYKDHSSLLINTTVPNDNTSKEFPSNDSIQLNHSHINSNKTETDMGTKDISENIYDIEPEMPANEPSLNRNLDDITVVKDSNTMEVTKSETKEIEMSLQNNNIIEEQKITERNIISVEEPVKNVENINKVQALPGLTEKIDKGFESHDKLKSTESSVHQGKLQSNSMYRPTLTDDSRLVRISLPTNAMSLMQSNAHFINKSRNFLNFITEKSTNIMEKALLPQHLTMKYNTTYTNNNERKNIEQPSMKRELSPKHSISLTESDATKKVMNPPVSFNYGATELNKSSEVKDQVYSISDSSSTDLTDGTLINTKDKCVVNVDKNITNVAAEKPSITVDEVLKNDLVEDQDHQNDSTDLVGNGQQTSSLQHPMYLNLLKEYAKLKDDNKRLLEKIETLETRNGELEKEKSVDFYKTQICTLENTLSKLTSKLHTALTTQQILEKEHSATHKEMESMVMKYAASEEHLIYTQRAKDFAEQKVKEVMKEQELLQNKLRQVQGERTRICNILDGKCREVSKLQKEVERLTADTNMKEVKLKWAQNKLNTEMELQKDTQQKLDKALSKINEMKEECEQVRKETEETMKKFQVSEENKAVTLDEQLKEQQARLILERHVIEDKEMLRLQLQKEVETLLERQQILIEENNTLSIRIQGYEQRQVEYQDTLNNLKTLADERQKEIFDLSQKVSQLEGLKSQLEAAEENLKSNAAEVEKLQLANKELESDMYACRQRETAMLDFTLKLTDKNVSLQTEFTALEAKTKQLEEEQGPLREQVKELKHKIKLLEDNVILEQKKRIEECETLKNQLTEQTQLAQNLAQQLQDSQGENIVLKRKQQISMKEMTRELQKCRKKLEALESSSPSSSLDVASRTGSNTSLNTGETLNGALSDNSTNGEQYIRTLECSIVKLQKENAKKAEKLDFLEEHKQLLIKELQKKNRIIQNYLLHESSGAMGSNERDKNKAELARHGGIMASVYSQKVSDENMTLELSLEINQKLHTVLEEILLKNITLKDNIDTLGKEIAKLTMQNQQKQLTS